MPRCSCCWRSYRVECCCRDELHVEDVLDVGEHSLVLLQSGELLRCCSSCFCCCFCAAAAALTGTTSRLLCRRRRDRCVAAAETPLRWPTLAESSTQQTVLELRLMRRLDVIQFRSAFSFCAFIFGVDCSSLGVRGPGVAAAKKRAGSSAQLAARAECRVLGASLLPLVLRDEFTGERTNPASETSK
jgi:hypothetical protein